MCFVFIGRFHIGLVRLGKDAFAHFFFCRKMYYNDTMISNFQTLMWQNSFVNPWDQKDFAHILWQWILMLSKIFMQASCRSYISTSPEYQHNAFAGFWSFIVICKLKCIMQRQLATWFGFTTVRISIIKSIKIQGLYRKI